MDTNDISSNILGYPSFKTEVNKINMENRSWDPGEHKINNNDDKNKEYKKEKSKLSVKVGNYIYYSPAIGKGSFSKVYLGTFNKSHDKNSNNNSKKNVAIKKIDSSSLKKLSSARLQREIDILKKLKHPNIVEFIDTFVDVGNNVYVVTEYCNYGSLEQYIGGKKYPGILLNEEEIKSLIIQLKEGLKFLLANNILHRDLKPQNILLHKEGDVLLVKIADFGFAKYFESLEEDTMMETLCGTPLYLAPEIIKEKRYTIYSDLWSIGVIIYQLFYHTTPFKQPKNILELIRNLDVMKISFNNKDNKNLISSDAKDLMVNLLSIDPSKRITWGNFFEHPWFTDYNETGNDSMLNSSMMSTIMASKSILTKTISNNKYVDKNTKQSVLDSIKELNLETINVDKNDCSDDEQKDIVDNINNIINNNDNSLEDLRDKLFPSRKLKKQEEIERQKKLVIEQEDIELKECFLHQSSRLYQNPKFLDNYIPQSSSVPCERNLHGRYDLYRNNNLDPYFSGSSISPDIKSEEVYPRSPSPFCLSLNQSTIVRSKPINIPRTTSMKIPDALYNFPAISNLATSISNTNINPILQMIGNTISNSISYLGNSISKISFSPNH